MEKNEIEMTTKLSMGKYKFVIATETKDVYFLKEIDEISDQPKKTKNNNEEFFNIVIYEKKKYEAIKFNPKHSIDTLEKVFNIVIESDEPLCDVMSELNNIFKDVYKHTTQDVIRGCFAELSACIKHSLKPSHDANSIYDFSDDNNNDVEVKSFSKVKREVKISYQQLTNNESAKFIFIEIYETSDGESVLQLLKKLPIEYKAKYLFLDYATEAQLNQKFATGEYIFKKSNELSIDLQMPRHAKDAVFTFAV